MHSTFMKLNVMKKNNRTSNRKKKCHAQRGFYAPRRKPTVNRNNVNRLYLDRNITRVNKMPGTTRIVINV